MDRPLATRVSTVQERPQVSALDWYATMSAPVLARHEAEGHLSIRRYTGASAEMKQPALTDNLLCLHLGGPKKVQRWHGGRTSVHDVPLGALTIMPAWQVNRWQTTGPIDFAHVTLSQSLLGQVAQEEFDKEPKGCELLDLVGVSDPYLEQLFRSLLVAVEGRGAAGRLYPESLLVILSARLLSEHAVSGRKRAFPASSLAPKGGLAGWRLRRVADYMAANLASDIGLAELTALTGLSRAQFFRAFRQSTGLSPHRYHSMLRLERARALLEDTDLSVAEVAAAVGLLEGARFTARFRDRFGVVPRQFRLSRT